MAEPIVLAIPAFFLMIGAEYAAWRRHPPEVRDYRLHDTVANLGCGAGQQVIGAFLLGAMVWGYEAVRARVGLFELPADSVAVWLGTLLGVDFLYYWFHRSSHRVNFLWAAHVVHHQSEHYNLGVALRQSWLQQVFSFFYYLPLALLGVPVAVFLATVGIDTLYQFWIHTKLVKRTGFFERWFNTPAHHRVHHGVDAPYLDRNHAGMLIVWDKLFGTFEPEAAEPRYGTVKPLRSVNPVWANVEPWVELWRRAAGMSRLGDRLRVFFAPPEWRAADEPAPAGPLRTDIDYALYTPPATPGRSVYVAAHFVLVLGAVLALLTAGAGLPLTLRAAIAVWILLSFGVIGGLAEGRRWAGFAEPARLLALGLLAAAAVSPLH
jgi:sterol desaturase/sphingolipid hydroxylase (fatty acid hydroxylase superfamily)